MASAELYLSMIVDGLAELFRFLNNQSTVYSSQQDNQISWLEAIRDQSKSNHDNQISCLEAIRDKSKSNNDVLWKIGLNSTELVRDIGQLLKEMQEIKSLVKTTNTTLSHADTDRELEAFALVKEIKEIKALLQTSNSNSGKTKGALAKIKKFLEDAHEDWEDKNFEEEVFSADESLNEQKEQTRILLEISNHLLDLKENKNK